MADPKQLRVNFGTKMSMSCFDDHDPVLPLPSSFLAFLLSFLEFGHNDSRLVFFEGDPLIVEYTSFVLRISKVHFISANGTSFQRMALHFSQWHFISANGTSLSEWHFISANGTSFQRMALHFSQWHFISANGTSFQPMALHFSEWHFISANGT
ncbi:hypothetical protein niasHS_011927 [Heterodera schachtii]|uniref:Uncharacterized protein n=1 Tax=Heterodera schachtii TaxID=97005 RepID=A0ABD2IPQ7_HETSC